MINVEVKLKGSNESYQKIEEAIRTFRFVQNKCLRKWIDSKDTEDGFGKYSGSYYCKNLREEFEFVRNLSSQSCQAAAERTWGAINRFYKRCKLGIKPVGFPKFKKTSRSFELKQFGWRFTSNYQLQLSNIGTFKLYGGADLQHYSKDQIKRLKIVKRADGYYCLFAIDIVKKVEEPPTGKTIGLDLGLTHFYTDSEGNTVANPKFYQKAEKQLRKLNRRLSRKTKGGKNWLKAKQALGRKHLDISRQRKDFATKLARCVVRSNDFVAIENLSIKNMMKNHHLAKAIGSSSWYLFRCWLEYYGKVFGRVVIAIDPKNTSQNCSQCGIKVPKELSERIHNCPQCRLVMDRDHNAAINILKKGLSTSTAGQAGIYASGDESLYSEQSTASEQTLSLKEELS